MMLALLAHALDKSGERLVSAAGTAVDPAKRQDAVLVPEQLFERDLRWFCANALRLHGRTKDVAAGASDRGTPGQAARRT